MEKESLVSVFNEMKSIIPDLSGKETTFSLKEFECFLTAMRKKALDKAQENAKSIDRDHPMFGPVNLLRPMGRGRDELSYTKLLAYFLNPEESHGFGGKITYAFLNEIFGSEFEYDQISVASEYYCNTDSRIDLWITGEYDVGSPEKQKFLVITEAKVDASVDENQLSRYSECARVWVNDNPSGMVQKVLLIPDNKNSKGIKDWQELSFSNMANLIWGVIKDEKEQPGFHYIRFYLTSIYQDVLGWDLNQDPVRTPYSYLTAFIPFDSKVEN